ncbi:hypothetical protein ONZ45_g15695 [Pleurotus djamor]|nr:hypothetical protein ONZ45_g15695 [Pleurotus djamor]
MYPSTSSPLRATTWSLDVPNTDYPNHHGVSPTEDPFASTEPAELIDRTLYKNGGQFRSIVRILSYFPNGDFARSTGWLVAPDTVVTVGCVVYNRGTCRNVICFIGGRGTQADTFLDVQWSYGAYVVTSSNRIGPDIAFIRLHTPFAGVLNELSFVDATPRNTLNVIIVGYHSSLGGVEMYASPTQTSPHLQEDEDSLQKISYTFPSKVELGSPILSMTEYGLVAVGTHCNSNFGAPIGGKYGVPYTDCLALFNQENSFFEETGRIKYVPLRPGVIPSSDFLSIRPGGAIHTPARGFHDALLDIGSLPFDSPAVVMAIVVGGLLASLLNGSGAAPAAVERAALAEVSLQAVLALSQKNPYHPLVKAIISAMATEYIERAPNTESFNSILGAPLAEIELDITLWPLSSTGASLKQVPDDDPFLQSLLELAPGTDGREGSDGFFASLVTQALVVAEPLTSFGDHTARSWFPERGRSAIRLLLKRAVIADMALSVLRRFPPDQLNQFRLRRFGSHGDAEEQSIFAFIMANLQKIGPLVLYAASEAVKRRGPDLLKHMTSPDRRQPAKTYSFSYPHPRQTRPKQELHTTFGANADAPPMTRWPSFH